MTDCIFCRIVAREIPCDSVYEDEWVLAFRDLSPQAPEHILIIPKRHIASANEFDANNSFLAAKIFEAVPKVAALCGLTSYRIVSNCGSQAGQSVGHLHFHLLGGRDFAWPPG